MEWHAPIDPDCPEVEQFMTTLHDDPMTEHYGVGGEIAEEWEKKHRLTCLRCQQYGAANIEVR